MQFLRPFTLDLVGLLFISDDPVRSETQSRIPFIVSSFILYVVSWWTYWQLYSFCIIIFNWGVTFVFIWSDTLTHFHTGVWTIITQSVKYLLCNLYWCPHPRSAQVCDTLYIMMILVQILCLFYCAYMYILGYRYYDSWLYNSIDDVTNVWFLFIIDRLSIFF